MQGKLATVRMKVVEANSASALEAAFATWRATLTEEQLVGVEYAVSGSKHAALILYSE